MMLELLSLSQVVYQKRIELLCENERSSSVAQADNFLEKKFLINEFLQKYILQTALHHTHLKVTVPAVPQIQHHFIIW